MHNIQLACVTLCKSCCDISKLFIIIIIIITVLEAEGLTLSSDGNEDAAIW